MLRKRIMNNTSRCRKCGRIIPRKVSGDCFLDDYEADQGLCVNCNAVKSVINRFKSGGTITKEDLRKLPKYLIFDPNDTDSEEAAYALKLMETISRTQKETE